MAVGLESKLQAIIFEVSSIEVFLTIVVGDIKGFRVELQPETESEVKIDFMNLLHWLISLVP